MPAASHSRRQDRVNSLLMEIGACMLPTEA